MDLEQTKQISGKTRIDKYLIDVLDESRSHIKTLIEGGFVKLNGMTVLRAGEFVRAGDTVDVAKRETAPTDIVPENIPLNIIYQDDDLAVVFKPAGMVTHPGAGQMNGTLVNALLFHLNGLSGINGVERPGIVHRLDKDTSGLLVVAKNDTAHVELQRQIQKKECRRIYVALVNGNIKTDNGIIDAPIGRHKKDRKKMAVDWSGRSAVTHYRVLDRAQNKRVTFVEFELKTGRTHQIRVHSAHMGNIVVGDKVYGDSGKIWDKGQLLHAKKLIFTHPKTGEEMAFETELPDSFLHVLKLIIGD